MSLVSTDTYLITKDIITLLLAIAGAVIAGLGLATWRKQTKGIKEFETAYNLNYSVLKLREAIKNVRHPFISNSEMSKGLEFYKSQNQELSTEKSSKSAQLGVYDLRWQKISKAWIELESHLLAGEILWGEDVHNLIKPLLQKTSELNIALEQNFNPELRTMDHGEIRRIIYGGFGKPDSDAFGAEIERIIENIKLFLKKKLL